MSKSRLRLETAKAHSQGSQGPDSAAFDKAIDTFVATVRARYGEEVPVVEAAGLLRDFQLPTGATHSAVPLTGSGGEKTLRASASNLRPADSSFARPAETSSPA